jgi:hypothetical protein
MAVRSLDDQAKPAQFAEPVADDIGDQPMRWNARRAGGMASNARSTCASCQARTQHWRNTRNGACF